MWPHCGHILHFPSQGMWPHFWWCGYFFFLQCGHNVATWGRHRCGHIWPHLSISGQETGNLASCGHIWERCGPSKNRCGQKCGQMWPHRKKPDLSTLKPHVAIMWGGRGCTARPRFRGVLLLFLLLFLFLFLCPDPVITWDPVPTCHPAWGPVTGRSEIKFFG